MKSTWVRFLVLVVIGFGIGAALALVQEMYMPRTAEVIYPPKPPDAISTAEEMAGVPVGGAFTLVDHNGNMVTEASWPGKYKLVFFGFTHCPDICPAAMDKLGTLMEEYEDAEGKIVSLFISIDPTRDTPEVMARYVEPFDSKIIGLTGTQEQVDEAVARYRAFVAKIPTPVEYMTEEEKAKIDHNAYMMDHSGYIYLMSPEDKLLATYGTDMTAAEMVEKTRMHIEKGEAAPVSEPEEEAAPAEAPETP